VSLATGFWQQVDLWPSPNWPTVIVAYVVGFAACCASAIIYDMRKMHSSGKFPWDATGFPATKQRFWTYVCIRVTFGLCCGFFAVAIALLPFLAVIAVGISPREALKILSAGMGNGDDDSGGNAPREQDPRGQEGEDDPDA
jgi:hypothetical protein